VVQQLKATLLSLIALCVLTAMAVPSPARAAGAGITAGAADASGSPQGDVEDEYEDDEKTVTIADPLEPFNRDMYAINDFLILYALEPAAKGVKAVVPWEFRTIFRNMRANLLFPVRFVGCLLQGKWEKGGDEFASFFLNTTVGFLGMADVAAAYPGLAHSPEDMGQTFAVWGWKDSSFLTLPFFGPSTIRDALGKLPDIVLDPLFWYLKFPESVEVRGAEAVNDTTFRIGDYEALKKASLDPYVAIRNGFAQNREKLIGE
jgi:phospholipid-binding lipoprotein MlaA